MKYENVEFSCEQEGTPGTAETLVEADVLVQVRRGFDVSPEQEMISLEEVSSTSSPVAQLPGRKTGVITVPYNLRGPGDLTTAPAVADLWEAAMLSGAAAKTIAVGAITSGPYTAGEVITGGTSTATGLVLQQTADGASSIPYLPLSGTLQTTETLTGGTSGATCTSSGAPADGGWAFRPADSDDLSGHCCTARMNIDGYYWTLRGALADIEWSYSNGGPCIVTQRFEGALTAQGDLALYGVTTFPEASVSTPAFLNASIYFGSYQPSGIAGITVAFPNNIEPVEDANDSSGDGIKYSDYDRQPPTIRLAVDQVATSTYNYFSTMQAGTTLRYEHTLGSTEGSTWTQAAPAAQFVGIKPVQAGANRAAWEVELILTSPDNNNNELLTWVH